MSQQLTTHDEQDLIWFFSKGQIAFERSTFGSMLERAELFSVAQLYHSEMRPKYDDCGRVIGFERRLTARPTCETRCASGYVPDLDTLRRYAHVSAVLKRVERQSPIAAQVLELVHGDVGARWAPTDPYGRLGSLFHLTAKGKSLLVKDTRKVPNDISPPARMWVLAGVECAQPNKERGQALAYCLTQAQALERAAREAWEMVRSGGRMAA